MIISRTPFRVSFVGGGTDLPSFYNQEPGAVLSTTINKYVYITVNKRFDETLRISYSRTEIADSLDLIQHPLFRETMKTVGADAGLEITSIADVPSGTGLGSSSSFTVGLLHALYAYRSQYKAASDLAHEACHIEMDILAEPIGKQDQYAAAFGGLRRYQFNGDEKVHVDPVICTPETRAALFEHLMLFYLGGSRDASQVLREQSRNTNDKISCLRRMRDAVERFQEILTRGTRLNEIGELLDEAWKCKRQLAHNVTNCRVDECYERAKTAGALGGKLLGAGIGGFLLLFCEPQKRTEVRNALRELREIAFEFEPEGSKIIYVGN